MTTFISISLIFFLAGWVQGVSGFGSALVAIPLLSLLIDIKTAIPLCSLLSLIITTYMSVQLWKYFDRKKILPLCAGAIPGIISGATILKTVPSEMIQNLMGSLLIAYALYNLFFTVKPGKIHYSWGYVSGFLSGSIGAAFSAGGPPAIIYTTLNNWSKNEIKATLTGFFCFNSYMVVSAHIITGLTTATVGKYFLFSVPFVLLGTFFGSYCYRFFKKDIYLRVVFLCLVVMGIILIL
ncbi:MULTISPECIES: sulfite exporter TauE/SafE family protein [Desulfobacula]|uniref:Probable membrane transporter protein n=2 Tax=Desulfobacula TaxID=28222 RepID=K0NI86_DESTT|nr:MULTISPECIES: sulfite exporter TauE/SafE family protein [Desulfobacula]CCK80660.1 conserved uncharacterized protein, DUF81 [Desulfobacula toluolica Tol2]SDT93767.1 hypothetical protein SAMN04487931_10372 [Desulfobacula phenolica]